MQLDPVTIQVLWNRLVSLVDEAATGCCAPPIPRR